MSETNTPAPETPVAEEDRLAAILGIEDEAPEENAAPEGEDDAAEQAPAEAAQPEEKTEDEPQDLAPIDPPAFWTKEAKEHWSAIPPATQEYLAHREAERDREVRNSQNEAAQARQAAEQAIGQVAAERAYLAQQVAPAIQELTNRMAGKDYSPQALAELARTNPAQWAERVAERDQMLAQQNELAQLQAQAQHNLALQELSRLVEKVPEWKDQTVAKKAVGDLAALANEFGYSKQEMDTLVDHRAFLVLRELHQLRAEKAAREAVAKKAAQPASPRTVNATRPRPDPAAQRALSRDQVLRAARSGSQDEQIAALAQIMGVR